MITLTEILLLLIALMVAANLGMNIMVAIRTWIQMDTMVEGIMNKIEEL